MAETLGEKLKAAREERGISISEVAEQTRIAPMYIECIENDNYKPLPGGIFNKGFVKSYARFVGYDETQAVQEYGAQLAANDPTGEGDLRQYKPEVLTDDNVSQFRVSTVVFAGLILALMSGGVYFLVNYWRNQPQTPAVATNTATANSNTNTGTTDPLPTPPVGDIPTMQSLKVEFRTANDPISLSATADGKSSVNTVVPGTPQTYEPKENIKLSYSKSLSSSAQLFLNGKQITLPTVPANPKRAAIEIELNSTNLAQTWESGQYSFPGTAPVATSTPGSVTATASPSPSATQPVAGATATPRLATPAPSVRTTPAAANTGTRPTQTPIVVGGNRNAAPRRTPD